MPRFIVKDKNGHGGDRAFCSLGYTFRIRMVAVSSSAASFNRSTFAKAEITILDVLTLKTLADVRMLVEQHLPAEYRSKFIWRQLAGLLAPDK